MKKIIYCIENIKNGFKYVGQSINPKKRLQTHFSNLRNNKHENRKFQESFNEFGISNFISYNLTDYIENYDEVEQFYIVKYKKEKKCYNKYVEAGIPPIIKGENHPKASITNEQCCEIMDLLKYTKLTMKDIVEKLNTSIDVVSRINTGSTWFCEFEDYPIRKNKTHLYIIDMLKNTNYTQKEIAKMFDVARSCITMINIGENHHDKNIIYPIRK